MRRRMSHIDIWMKNPTRTKHNKIHGHGGGAALVSVRSRENPCGWHIEGRMVEKQS